MLIVVTLHGVLNPDVAGKTAVQLDWLTGKVPGTATHVSFLVLVAAFFFLLQPSAQATPQFNVKALTAHKLDGAILFSRNYQEAQQFYRTPQKKGVSTGLDDHPAFSWHHRSVLVVLPQAVLWAETILSGQSGPEYDRIRDPPHS